jgi:hypothetical protein
MPLEVTYPLKIEADATEIGAGTLAVPARNRVDPIARPTEVMPFIERYQPGLGYVTARPASARP